MTDVSDVYPIRLEGSSDVIAFALAQADKQQIDRSEPIAPEEPFSSPQSAIVGTILQNLQMIDLVFKTSADGLAFLTALAAFVKLPTWKGTVAVKNVRSNTVLDPAKNVEPEKMQAFLHGT